MERQLVAATESELEKLGAAARDLSGVRWGLPAPAAERIRRVAIVAADAGNVRLRLNPLRIAFVRVATSMHEAPLGEVVFPSELDAGDLVELLRSELGGLLAPLDVAGLDVDRLLASTGARQDRLAAVREILEWGAVLGAVSTALSEPVLVVRDGLLRSIHFDAESFGRLHDALLAASRRTGNRLVAVAKRVPGGADLANALLLGGVLDRRPDAPVAWLAIPTGLERELLPGSFVVGRRMGPLLLVRVRRTGTFVPVEVADSEPDAARVAVASLFDEGTEYWPEPGMPIEVAIAHQRARISALDREWLHRAFIDALNRRDPRLANRALTAEVLGAGGPIVTEAEE